MTIKASNHCAKEFAHSAPGLMGVRSYGPPPLFGAWNRKDNVFYISAPVIVLPDTTIASGEQVVVTEFEDHRGERSDPSDFTLKKMLHE